MEKALRTALISCASLCIACLGCSDQATIVPVAGQVLIDGEPLTSGYVRFSPGEGRLSMGKIDEEGRFRLTCYEPGDGAMVGTHRIVVLAHEIVGGTKIKWHVPRKYSNYATSGLTAEITEPTDSLVIELSWDEDTHGDRPPSRR